MVASPAESKPGQDHNTLTYPTPPKACSERKGEFPALPNTGAAADIFPKVSNLPLDAIQVGERHRRDMGDIDGLAASIREIGLLNPITVDENGRLLAGARRLAACKRLGLETVEVKIVRCSDDLQGSVR
jgi:hypothetical protein